MNVFIRELKANRKALIIWCVCLVLLVLSGMGKYTAYSAGGTSSEVFNKFPNTLKVLLGIGSLDVSVMSGFFAFLFPYIEVTLAIHAALLGSYIIAKEERDKTTEFLIAKPVSRKYILTAKLLACLVNIILINIVTLITSYAMVEALNKGEDITGEVLIFFVITFIVQLIFVSLGTVLSSSLRRPKASGSIATAFLLVAYMLTKVTDLVEHLDVLNILTPFKYFDIQRVVDGEGISVVVTLLSLMLTAVLTTLTYYFYQRRDMNV